VNLKGGPAMQVSEFSKWEEKSLLGVSLKMVTPSGQYDPNNSQVERERFVDKHP
jgi:hypothetical protein